MNWRQIWQSTVANVRALFGTRPPTPPPKPPTPASPRALTGPAESYSRPKPLLPPPSAPQVIDLTRAASAPQAPLRRRPQIRDVGHAPVGGASPVPEWDSRTPSRLPREDEVVVVHAGDRFRDGMDFSPNARFRTQTALLRQAIHDVGMRSAPTAALPGPAPVAQETWDAPEPPAEPDHEEGFVDEDPGGADDPHRNGAGSNGPTDAGQHLPLSGLLESLLFVAAEPVDPNHLARSLMLPLAQIEQGLAQLAADLQHGERGLRLQRFNGRVQLVTAPAAAGHIESFLNLDTTARLSGPALETLAVIAYRQPVTRAQIEAVRGVDCAGVLRSLVQRGLVAEVGRLESVGRPILYGVTELFMQHFGLVEMDQLPPLEETEADRLWAATVLAEEGLEPGEHAAPGRVEGQ